MIRSILLLAILSLSQAHAQNVGIGTNTPHAPLQLSNSIGNRKLVLYEGGNNDHQFYGFGINGGALRYQVDAAQADHVFYAALGTTSSKELMRVKGNGNVGIGTDPTVRLDVAGANAWDLVNSDGDMRIGNAGYRIKMGIALAGGGAGAAGIMQAGGIGSLQLGANNKYQVELNGSGNYINLKNIPGGLQINGSAGSAGQVLTSNGAAAPTWSTGPSFTYDNSVNLTASSWLNINDVVESVVPGLTHTFSISKPTKALVLVNLQIQSIPCALCGYETVFFKIRVNGNRVFFQGYDIPNNQRLWPAASVMVDLQPGTYTIDATVTPLINSIQVGGDPTLPGTNMQVILFPS